MASQSLVVLKVLPGARCSCRRRETKCFGVWEVSQAVVTQCKAAPGRAAPLAGCFAFGHCGQTCFSKELIKCFDYYLTVGGLSYRTWSPPLPHDPFVVLLEHHRSSEGPSSQGCAAAQVRSITHCSLHPHCLVPSSLPVGIGEGWRE